MSSDTPESQPLTEHTEGPGCFMSGIKWFARSTGLVTLVVMWASMVVLLKDDSDHFIGYYLIPVNLVVTFFELTWIANKMACCVREGCCCRIWTCLMWVDNWKKFVLYGSLSVPLLLEGSHKPVSVVSGFLLTLTAVMYLLKSFYKPKSYVTIPAQRVVQKQPPISVVTMEISTQTEEGGRLESPPQKEKEQHDDNGPFTKDGN